MKVRGTRRRWASLLLILVMVSGPVGGCASVPPPQPPAAPAAKPIDLGDPKQVVIVPAVASGGKCCPPPTLTDFLGLSPVFKGLGAVAGGLFQRLRGRIAERFPGINIPRPPVKPPLDPSNTAPDAPPANRAAATIAQSKAAAPQKIQSLKTIAVDGWPEGHAEAAEEAFVTCLDDAEESVRFAAVQQLLRMAGDPCEPCKSSWCSRKKIMNKLYKILNDRDESGCLKEKSPRVLQYAQLAFQACGGAVDLEEEAPPQKEQIEVDKQPESAEPAAQTAAQATIQPTSFEQPLPAAGLPAAGLPVTGQPTLAAPPLPARPASPGRRLAGVAAASASGEALELGSGDVRGESTVQPGDWDGGEQPIAMVNGHPIRQAEVWGAAGEPSPTPGEVAQRLRTALEAVLIRQHAPYALRHRADLTAREILSRQVDVDPLVTREQLREYYETHPEAQGLGPALRWEEIFLPADRLPDRQQALEVINYLESVVRAGDGRPPSYYHPRLVSHRVHAWTYLRHISSNRLANTLFGLQVGEVGPVLEEPDGWHVVRLLERRPATRIPFEEAVPTIRELLIQQRQARQEQQLLDRWWREAHIWTALDGVKPSGAEHFTRLGGGRGSVDAQSGHNGSGFSEGGG